jgi:glycosyltransferase involved in cell wall biosynthesis
MAYDKVGAKVTVISPSIESVPDQEKFGKNIVVKRFAYFFPKRWQIVKRVNTPIYGRMNLLFYLQLPFFLLGFIIAVLQNARDMDIIHCNWTSAALVALPVKWFFKKPIVVTIRGSDIRLIPEFINRYIIKRVSAVIDCFGPYPQNVEILKKFKAPYVKLPLIVKEPGEKIMPKKVRGPNEPFTIVYLGRLDPIKLEVGLFTLLEAAHRLVQKYELKCIYVGNGTLKNDLMQKVQELNLEKSVRFEGYQLDIYPYLQKANLVIGGIATNAVCQEATASNNVQLIPKINGMHENIWTDKVNALLYEPGDADSMMQAIEFAIENPDTVEKIRQSVQNTAKDFIVWGRRGGQIYMQAFEKIIAQSRR